MKNTIFYFYFVMTLAALSAASCFRAEDAPLKKLARIEIDVPSDTINVSLGEELKYTGLTVKSDREVSYQWAYGIPSKGEPFESHKVDELKPISTSPTIDHAFYRIGSYLLRLRLDNGESIVYRYFKLNVNAGFDEGIAVLSNDPSGNAMLSFVKTLTFGEAAAGEQRVFRDIFAAEGRQLKHGTDLYLSNQSTTKGDYAAFLIATADEDGSLYHLDPKTLELFSVAKMKEQGTSAVEFGGEYSSSGGFGVYLRSADSRIFRYDMQLGYLNEMTNFKGCGQIERCVRVVNRSTAKSATDVFPYMFSEDTVSTRPSASAGVRATAWPGFKVVNIAAKRTASSSGAAYALLQDTAQPSSYKIMTSAVGSSAGRTWKEGARFTAESLKMDRRSKIIGTLESSDAYYTYGNAIYRWGLSTAPGTSPAITLPEGEQLRDIATNFMGTAKEAGGEDLLYAVTWNPNRAGDYKGSLYVYRFSDDSLRESFEGIFHDPVSVIYKYRIN